MIVVPDDVDVLESDFSGIMAIRLVSFASGRPRLRTCKSGREQWLQVDDRWPRIHARLKS